MANLEKPILISGAGIAGLSAALALAQKGFAVTICERGSELHEVGAGIQLAPNATRILARLGVLDELMKYAVEPALLTLSDGLNLKNYLSVNLKDIAQRRWHAPYITIHRADIQRVLLDFAKTNKRIELKLGHSVVDIAPSIIDAVDIKIACNEEPKHLTTPLLVGCDGVWSKLRQLQPLEENAVFSGFIAWRATIPMENIPRAFLSSLQESGTVSAWMGPSNHLVTYPIKSGKSYNFVAITKGSSPGKTWSNEGDRQLLLDHFKDWHPSILEIFRSTEKWTFWPLFQMNHMRFLGNKCQVFLGDASHAVLPFAAQGAAMAIEDAAALAEVLSMKDLTLPEALSLFNNIRTTRVSMVAKRGNFNRFVYHATGMVAVARNLMMKMRSPESFMSSLDWLYNYDATEFAKK